MSDQQRGYIPKAVTQREIETAFNVLYKILGKPTTANFPTMTLAELNGKITDATLDDDGDPRTPTAHASTHIPGGSDDIFSDCVIGSGCGLMLDNDNKTLLQWNR